MKKILSLFLSLIMMISISVGIDISAKAFNTNGIVPVEFEKHELGRCGDNIWYDYNINTCTLKIPGEGSLYDCINDDVDFYTFYQYPDWFEATGGKPPLVPKYYVEELEIQDGITYIGDYDFYFFEDMVSAKLPSTLEGIGDAAFWGCDSLDYITIPYNVTYIGEDAFPIYSNPDFYLKGYSGTAAERYAKKYDIRFVSLSPSVSLSTTSYTYNGKVKTPKVTAKKSGKVLKNGTDYTVTYPSGRKNAGKYAVKVKFKNGYKGTVTKYFTIKPKGTSLSSVKAGSKKITVKWKKQSTQTTGYQIQYSTSSKFKSPKYVTVSSNKTTSKSIKKLKSKKKYYVRVRTYKTVGKTKYYSSWSKAKSVTTKK